MTAERLVDVRGLNATLVELLRAPLQRALAGRRRYYKVRVDALGGTGQVVVGITGFREHAAVLFGKADLEPGNVFRAVGDAVGRLAF